MAQFGAHPQARPGGGRRVLVTGAAGQIGRIACAGLAARGWKVRGLDTVPLDGVDGLADPPVLADLADADAARRATAGVDAVVHLAGMSTEAAPMISAGVVLSTPPAGPASPGSCTRRTTLAATSRAAPRGPLTCRPARTPITG